MISSLSSTVADRALKSVSFAKNRQAVETAAVSAGSGQSGGALTANFKAAISSRAQRAQNAGLAPAEGGAEALAQSLAQAAAEVKDKSGAEAAAAFMAKVLQGVDENGFSLDGLTTAVGTALRDMGQVAGRHVVDKLAEGFNRDLGLPEGQGPEIKGLSRAIGDFFGLESTTDEAEAAGFDANGRWARVAAPGAEKSGQGASGRGTEESAALGLEIASGLTMEQVGADTLADLANFLRNDLGAESAAGLLESQPAGAGFMAVMDTVIASALDESAQPDAAGKLESYLNGNIKSEINALSAVNHNSYGQIEFEGWGFEGAESGDETGFSSKWRYIDRDDATYVRDGRTGKSNRAAGGETGYQGLTPGELSRKLDDAADREDRGSLVDTVV